jgi:hypothetical protein
VPGLNIGNIGRKASRPREDSMVVNEGDTAAPSAKKQRLAALDENVSYTPRLVRHGVLVDDSL